METDLYGGEMSSVRQGTEERNCRERRQKQTKACAQIHSCRKWKERKNEIHSFSPCSPAEITSSHSYTVKGVRCVQDATSTSPIANEIKALIANRRHIRRCACSMAQWRVLQATRPSCATRGCRCRGRDARYVFSRSSPFCFVCS